MTATPEQIDQQRRVIVQTKTDVAQLLILATNIRARLNTYTRLKLDAADPEAYVGTGTSPDAYAGAMAALAQFAAMPEEIFVALELFAS